MLGSVIVNGFSWELRQKRRQLAQEAEGIQNS